MCLIFKYFTTLNLLFAKIVAVILGPLVIIPNTKVIVTTTIHDYSNKLEYFLYKITTILRKQDFILLFPYILHFTLHSQYSEAHWPFWPICCMQVFVRRSRYLFWHQSLTGLFLIWDCLVFIGLFWHLYRLEKIFIF